MVKFNICPCIYWSDKLKMDYLERQIIVHSIIYYVLSSNTISDKEYDQLCKQLIQMVKQNKEIYKHTEYYYCMFDFDGNTGFDLYNRLIEHDREYLTIISNHVLKLYKGGK